MKKGKAKSGVMEMPFGMIFSILLIVIFIVVAFIAIRSFLNLSKCEQIGSFFANLQEDVDYIWKSSSKTQEFSSGLPSGIEYICFANFEEGYSLVDGKDIFSEISRYEFEEATLYIYPPQESCEMPYYNLKHINVTKITSRRNPYCIQVIDGKITMKLDKGNYDALVNIK